MTGVGLVTCLGGDASITWKRLIAGERGYDPADSLGRVLGCPVEHRRPLALIAQAAREALADADLEAGDCGCGVVVGTSRGLQADWERTGGLELPDYGAPARTVAALTGSLGAVNAVATACTSGAWAIGTGLQWIRWGLCERVIVGAVDAALTPLNLAGFRRAGALASGPCRPFDRRRTGFVLAEGAALLVLETERAARRRGARPYARLLAFATNADAYHPTAPHPAGEGLERATRACLTMAGLPAVDGIGAHGTGTEAGDAVEAAVIARLYGTRVPVYAPKGALGHSLGASSAIEAVLACLALRHGQIPPIVGLDEPAFDLDFVRCEPRSAPRSLLLHSLGFGGQNACLLFEACPAS